MSEHTAISWCDSTFNPWVGCQKVSQACDHCYAERLMDHRLHRVQWGGRERKRTGTANWRQPLQWNSKRFMQCDDCGWRGEAECALVGCGACGSIKLSDTRRRVFCASLADVFDNAVPAEWRSDLFALIERTPHLDWLLLTKRIGNAAHMIEQALIRIGDGATEALGSWPWPSVWLGATICNQAEADRDIAKLLAMPASVRFLSIEPMLGPVAVPKLCDSGSVPGPGSVGGVTCSRCDGTQRYGCLGVDWIICGGESGPHARPMHPDWVRTLRDQCAAAGVPFHFKQWGEWVPYEHSAQPPYLWSQHGRELDGHALPDFESDDGRAQCEWYCDFADQLLARRVGTKAAGRALDGVKHNGFPR